MAENRFLTYKDKPIVKCGKEIYYGDMSEPYVVRFNILSTKKEGDDTIPEKVSVELLKSDTQLPEKERVSKNTVKDSFFDALDVGFIWLERALKS
ncbi:MAG TPA: hypothetical protein DCP17_07680 [Ruminococcaceae bacterium]|nr:hypothetical protein [Oscillospiraceae bacterium]HAY97688.1 hypothetical protein [Oscillospiraceae bacterium]